MKIADRIRKIRGNLSQREFADRIGINMNTLRAYEKGRSLPPSEVLENICLNFDASPSWLLLGIESERRQESSQPTHQENCPRCTELEARLDKEREEVRELSKELRELNAENRTILKENGKLKEEIGLLKGELKARAAPTDKATTDSTESTASARKTA
ncbi:helix-turn-helix domain-containing protein [Halodesulfovibrio aestuarii]|uniref:Helix-turn-helix domain-containing protein n=1 Tax=Halodesulfovibrio aestuarii TaxID=126333 RepID=A0A8G2FA19_9BACT|nr:helix-turn-helix transcriptional regulator [Halodesulfovibrio aestuarii]SHI59715.1 Helix-turn-helix domain-containing protein [Halodesulfovibrio aestuarii]